MKYVEKHQNARNPLHEGGTRDIACVDELQTAGDPIEIASNSVDKRQPWSATLQIA